MLEQSIPLWDVTGQQQDSFDIADEGISCIVVKQTVKSLLLLHIVYTFDIWWMLTCGASELLTHPHCPTLEPPHSVRICAC
jgi:hypothetical protein